jgi:hypothetical protein
MTTDEAEAHSAADRLALALEDAGFDVGQEFPSLSEAIGRRGAPVVRLGDISVSVAERLAAVISLGSTREGGKYR